MGEPAPPLRLSFRQHPPVSTAAKLSLLRDGVGPTLKHLMALSIRWNYLMTGIPALKEFVVNKKKTFLGIYGIKT